MERERKENGRGIGRKERKGIKERGGDKTK